MDNGALIEPIAGVGSIDPGSFKDPDGGILYRGDRVFRYLNPAGAGTYETLVNSGLLDGLVSKSMAIESQPVPAGLSRELQSLAPQAAFFLEHPRLPFISYCYEWPFEMLKAAALLHLEVLSAALEQGFILKDATPYNVQFVGTKPLLIDVASFEPYQQGQPWIAYNEFCRLFLNPLVLQAFTSVRFQPWMRGSLNGITPGDLSRLLSWRHKLRPGVFTNVVLQAWLERKFASSADIAGTVRQHTTDKKQLLNLVTRVRKFTAKLKQRKSVSSWTHYEDDNVYSSEDKANKDSFVRSVLKEQSPEIVWDLGCNTGYYSLMAAKHAKFVVAMDGDPEAVGRLYQKAGEDNLNILPLVVDLLDPSPERGWAQGERKGLTGRGPADTVLALALVHHLAISGNVPFQNIVRWLASIGRTCMVEFVPKDDPALQTLLRWRKDVFSDYSQSAFEGALNDYFTVTSRCVLPGTGRVLYNCMRRER